MKVLTETLVDWPMAASLALAMTARGVRAGRRRGALNEALHELRRPLQSLVLAVDAGGAPSAVGGSARLATHALERLEREINGSPAPPRRETFAAQPPAEAAVARWKSRASLGGGSLELRWRAGETLVVAERLELAQALDNLILNAIEHGGPTVIVEASVEAGTLRIAVSDSGRASRPPARRETPAELVARLRGGRRHGHGIPVVRRIAARHGGRFDLRCSPSGSQAVLRLPLARPEGERAR